MRIKEDIETFGAQETDQRTQKADEKRNETRDKWIAR